MPLYRSNDESSNRAMNQRSQSYLNLQPRKSRAKHRIVFPKKHRMGKKKQPPNTFCVSEDEEGRQITQCTASNPQKTARETAVAATAAATAVPFICAPPSCTTSSSVASKGFTSAATPPVSATTCLSSLCAVAVPDS
mmetsp:Transcript_90478/g.189252  ORF Transcript_90478/g.189252 Transcript_90478/m.189252 type:complete len:137 (-) Transcript_90478:837-1247(-)